MGAARCRPIEADTPIMRPMRPLARNARTLFANDAFLPIRDPHRTARAGSRGMPEVRNGIAKAGTRCALDKILHWYGSEQAEPVRSYASDLQDKQLTEPGVGSYAPNTSAVQ